MNRHDCLPNYSEIWIGVKKNRVSTNKNDSKIQIDMKYLIDFEHTGSSIVQQSKSLENNINCNFMNVIWMQI